MEFESYDHSNDTVERFEQIIYMLNKASQNGDAVLNKEFDELYLNKESHSLGVISCYLRALYTVADKITNYHPLREYAIEFCKLKNYNPQVELFGLVDFIPWKPFY